MIELLAILLHLLAVISPATYFDYEIAQKEQENAAEIEDVRADENLHSWVLQEYSDEAELIWVIDTMGD